MALLSLPSLFWRWRQSVWYELVTSCQLPASAAAKNWAISGVSSPLERAAILRASSSRLWANWVSLTATISWAVAEPEDLGIFRRTISRTRSAWSEGLPLVRAGARFDVSFLTRALLGRGKRIEIRAMTRHIVPRSHNQRELTPELDCGSFWFIEKPILL